MTSTSEDPSPREGEPIQVYVQGFTRQRDDKSDLMISVIISAILLRKKLIAVVSLAFFVASVILALSLSPIYVAQITLLPARNAGDDSIMEQRLGGLVSLVGGKSSGNTVEDEALAILNSRKFGENFIRANDLRKILFRERWNAGENTWRSGQSYLTSLVNIFSEVASGSDKGHHQTMAPSLWESYKKFKELYYVKKDPKTGIIVLSVEWTDPQKAADWANEMVRVLNSSMKAHAVEEGRKKIQFLDGQTKDIQNATLKASVSRLVEREMATMMMANIRDEYALKVIDPAVAPEEKSKPHRSLIVIFGLVLGFFLSSAYSVYAYHKGHLHDA